MIWLKIYRDDLRELQLRFFPYMQRWCEMKEDTAGHDMALYLSAVIIHCHFQEVKKIVDKKLNGIANRFTLKLTRAQGSSFYQLLMNFPIEVTQYYQLKLRTDTCEVLLTQIQKPVKRIEP